MSALPKDQGYPATGRAIVFDFGGVLFNWHPPSLVKRSLPHHGLEDDAVLALVAKIFQGYGGDWADFDRGTVEPDALVQRIALRTGLSEADVRSIVDAVPDELRPIPASVDMLSRLREAGMPLYYLSNMPAPYATHLEQSHDFIGWFHRGVFSARVKLIKPEPAIFEHAAEHFGRAPADLMFLDDHLPNVLAAREAGWQALHYDDAARVEQALRNSGWWPA